MRNTSDATYLRQNASDLSQLHRKVLPLREQMRLKDELLRQRLEVVLPKAMADADIDFWLVITAENNEDPLTAALLPATLMEPRGKMLLAFAKQPDGSVERMSLSMPAGVEHLYINPWYGVYTTEWKGIQFKKPTNTQFECLREQLERHQPTRIGISLDDTQPVANGLRHGDYLSLAAALGEDWMHKMVSAAPVAVRVLETRLPAEQRLYAAAVQIAHAIVDEAFSSRVITPYVTTNEDVRFYMMQRAIELGLPSTFDCSVAVFRHGLPGMHNEELVILPGDVVHCDFGVRYMNLCTDTQELAYVLREGESDAPQGLKHALAQANRLQEIVRTAYVPGRSGNDILREALAKANAEGLRPCVYCHPIGFHPHAAGTCVGRFSNQAANPAGEYPLLPDTAHALELNNTCAVPEWGGQDLMTCLETEIFFDGEQARYLAGQQTAFHLVY